MGRNKKDINQKFKHNKFTPDNIRLRYKRCFFKYLIETINNRINKCPKLKKIGTIKKLNSCTIKKTKKNGTLSMLNLTVKEYLSLNITSRCKKLSKDVIEILDKTIRELMIIFCSDPDKFEEFKDFKRLKYHIDNELREKKHENDRYIALFEDQAKHFEKNYKKLNGRNET